MQELTRPVPLDGVDRQAIGVAVVAVFALWVAIALRFALTGAEVPRRCRVVAAAAFLSTSVLAVGFVGWVGATEWRATQIQGGYECGSVPAERIPRQVVQLSCSDSELLTGQANTVFAGLLAAPFALLGWAWARSVASRARPIGAVVGAIVLGGIFVSFTVKAIGDGDALSDVLLPLGIVTLYGVAAVGSWLAIEQRPPARPMPE